MVLQKGILSSFVMSTLVIYLIIGLYSGLTHAKIGPIQRVYQCFATKGNPFVSMNCARNQRLVLNSALHGRHLENTTECYVKGDDCVEDQMKSFYDWQDCIGRTRCVTSVQQSWMPSCGNYSQYLQADYSCVPDYDLINICKRGRYTFDEHGGYLRSPDYPDHYPHSRDCECSLQPQGTDHIFFSFFDLSLAMLNNAECADWLLIESTEEGYSKRTDLNCGEVLLNTKNITIKGTDFKMHFHSDQNDQRTQAFRFNSQRNLKGFWIYFKAEPAANITMTCGPTRPKLLRKLKPSPTRKPKDGDYYLGSGENVKTSMVTILLGLLPAMRR